MPATAKFVSRDCIGCGGRSLSKLAGGRFGDDPVRSLLENSIWGVQPLPYIADAPWELARCNDCGQAFHRYVLDPAWQEIRFREWMGYEAIREFERVRGMDTFDNRFRGAQEMTGHVLRIEQMTRTLRGDEPVRLLDFGCGWGHLLALATLFGFEAYGLDRDANRLNAGEASRVYPDLASLDAATHERPFHAVTLIEVLEHLDDPLAALLLVRQRLAPGGVLIVEAPNCEGVTDIRNEAEYDLAHPLEHINTFTPKTLQRFVARAGFTVERPQTAHVTVETARILKASVKKALLSLRPTTRFYFKRD